MISGRINPFRWPQAVPLASSYPHHFIISICPPLQKWLYVIGVLCTVLPQMAVTQVDFHWIFIPWGPQCGVTVSSGGTCYQDLRWLDLSFVCRSDILHMSGTFGWPALHLWAIEARTPALFNVYSFSDRCFWRAVTLYKETPKSCLTIHRAEVSRPPAWVLCTQNILTSIVWFFVPCF